jgi:V/A-type H+-transporting ATPase subunit I
MFEPQAMTKVVVAGSKDYMGLAIDSLYKHNAVHITDFVDEDEDFKIGKPYAQAVKLSERAVSLRSIASYLGITGKEEVRNRYPIGAITDEIDEKTERLNFEVTQVTDKISDIDSRIKDISDQKRLLDPLSSFDLSLDLYRGYRSLAVFVGTLKTVLSISDITNDFELETVPYGKGHAVALFVPKEFEDDVLKRLQDQSYSALSLPEMEGTPKEVLADLDAQLIELESEKEKRQEDLKALRQRYADYILASDEYLSIATQKAEAPLRFATTKNAFIIEGWIPTKSLELVQRDVDHATDGHVMVATDTSEAVSVEKVPIALENPMPSEPFEVLVRAFSLPRYNEIDPTTFVALIYPFLFALMLGDIGYGVVIIVIGLVVRRLLKSKGIRDLAAILVYAGVITLAFGLIYNEFFGVDLVGKSGLILPSYPYPTIPRFDNVLTLLLVTLVIGILMLTLGYVLGFINEYRQHGLKHAVFAKMSWLLMLYGGVLVIIEILPPLTTGTAISISPPLVGGLVLLVIGLLFLLLDEGILGIAELPSLLSNVLSYSRLLSIGIASAGIALAVNRLSYALFIDKGGVWIIFGVLMLIVGHAVNTALGILDSGLQSLRLHYVEFFTKFYSGGGMKYKPFGYLRKYTEEQ